MTFTSINNPIHNQNIHLNTFNNNINNNNTDEVKTNSNSTQSNSEIRSSVLRNKLNDVMFPLSSLDNFDLSNLDYSKELGKLNHIQTQAFEEIKSHLMDLGWEVKFQKDKDHCYTQTTLNVVFDPDENEDLYEMTDSSSDTKELKYDEEKSYGKLFEQHLEKPIKGISVNQTKTVYLNENKPLIDLLHELDHVSQMECEHTLRVEEDEDHPLSEYLMSSKINFAINYGGELANLIEDEEWVFIDGGMNSGYNSRSEAKQKYTRDLSHTVLDLIITKKENEGLEYGAYLREEKRYEKVNIQGKDKDEISNRIKDFEENQFNTEDDSTLAIATLAVQNWPL